MSEESVNQEQEQEEKPPEQPVYDAVQKDETVKIRRKDGVVVDYVIREMDGDGLSDWAETVAKRVKTDRRGKIIRHDLKGLHADLISRCLRTPDGDVVPRAMIKSWGSHLQNFLFDKCQKINGLTDDFGSAEGKD